MRSFSLERHHDKIPAELHNTETDRPPVVMLHGGLMNSETSWGPTSPTLPELLSEHRRVVQYDRRGHGRTADTDEPFHFASMAVEAASVIETLDLAPVAVVGYSDGGNLLLHLLSSGRSCSRRWC